MINCSCCRGSRFKHSKSGCGSAPTSILPDWLGQLSSICLTSRQPEALGRQQVGVFLAQGQIQSSGAPTEAGTCSLPSFCLHLGLTDGRLCTRQTVHAPNGNGLCQSCWMLGCSPIRGACNCCSLFSTYLTLDLIKLNHHESSLFSDQLTVN